MKYSQFIFIFLVAVFANQVLFLPLARDGKNLVLVSCIDIEEESAKKEKEATEKDGEEKEAESVLNKHSVMICLMETCHSAYGKFHFKGSQFKKMFSPPPEACQAISA